MSQGNIAALFNAAYSELSMQPNLRALVGALAGQNAPKGLSDSSMGTVPSDGVIITGLGFVPLVTTTFTSDSNNIPNCCGQEGSTPGSGTFIGTFTGSGFSTGASRSIALFRVTIDGVPVDFPNAVVLVNTESSTDNTGIALTVRTTVAPGAHVVTVEGQLQPGSVDNFQVAQGTLVAQSFS